VVGMIPRVDDRAFAADEQREFGAARLHLRQDINLFALLVGNPPGVAAGPASIRVNGSVVLCSAYAGAPAVVFVAENPFARDLVR
jgi:hypothetical protein